MKKILLSAFCAMVSTFFLNAQQMGGGLCNCGGTCSVAGSCSVTCNPCQQPSCEDGWFSNVCKCEKCASASSTAIPEVYNLSLDPTGAPAFDDFLSGNNLSYYINEQFKGYVTDAKNALSTNDYLSFVEARDNIDNLANNLTGLDKSTFDNWFSLNGFTR